MKLIDVYRALVDGYVVSPNKGTEIFMDKLGVIRYVENENKTYIYRMVHTEFGYSIKGKFGQRYQVLFINKHGVYEVSYYKYSSKEEFYRAINSENKFIKFLKPEEL